VDWKQWEGRMVGERFPLRRCLGGTSRSAVYLTAAGDGAKAAIKLIPLDSGAAEAWLLRRELASHLSHPGLLRLLEFGRCEIDGEGLVFAVMEYADEDLSLVIPSRALDPAEARDVLRSITETLTYLHSQGFVHGRLTPANILALGDRIKLSSDSLLRIGEPFEGSVSPLGAPESAHGMTEASDVWSLGMALVEMLTREPPAWDRAGDPEVPASMPAPYRDIALRCLRVDPRRRCSLADVQRDLDSPKKAATAPPVPRPEPQPVAVRPPRGKMAWLAAGVIAGVVLIGAILSRHSSPPAPPPPVVAATVTPSPAPAVSDPKPAPFPDQPSAERRSPESPAVVPPSNEQKTGEVLPAPTPTPVPLPQTQPAETGATERPQPVVPPQYLATIHGSVRIVVRVQVDSAGTVSRAEIATSGGRYFDRISLETARKWKFEPGESARAIEFDYRPGGCKASERTRRP